MTLLQLSLVFASLRGEDCVGPEPVCCWMPGAGWSSDPMMGNIRLALGSSRLNIRLAQDLKEQERDTKGSPLGCVWGKYILKTRNVGDGYCWLPSSCLLVSARASQQGLGWQQKLFDG